MVQYYTLEEAAKLLRITADKLKEMVKTGKVRAFQDRGTLRFRTQEIDELARAQGIGSDSELQVGEAKKSKLGGGPSSSARRKSKVDPPADDDDASDFDFTLSTDDDQSLRLGGPPSSGGKSSSPSSSKNKSSSSKNKGGPRSSDSDVRLVADGSDLDFQLSLDDNTPMAKSPPPAPRKSRLAPAKKGDSKLALPAKKGDSKLAPPAKRSDSKLAPGSQSDSEVRLVPPAKAGSDSDVKIVPESDSHDSAVSIGQRKAKLPSDSDIRLETEDVLPGLGSPKRPGSDPLITDEIDLDLESMKADQALPKKKDQAKAGPGAGLPTSSPFELSEADIDVTPPTPAPAAGDKDLTDSSSDFELAPLGTGEDNLESSSDETPALKESDEISLGEVSGAKGASGINLQDPADSGISLEADGSDEMEFELTLEDSVHTPTPDKKKEGVDSSSEFELTLDEDAEKPASDSEFELTLDDDSSGSSQALTDESDSGSDSEFELTLDEEGSLAPVEEESDELEAQDKDLFEEDSGFDVPSLDDESGSEAVALEDSGSDFDLALDDSVVTEGEESSGSQVVDLEDEEESDDAAETVARPLKKGQKAPDLEDSGRLDLDLDSDAEAEGEEELDDEEGEPARVREVPVEAAPAEWGVLPTVFMLPCVIVLFVVGLMGYELVQGMWSYHKGTKHTAFIVKSLAEMFDDSLPKD